MGTNGQNIYNPSLFLAVISDLGNTAAAGVRIIFTGNGTVMDAAAVTEGLWLTFPRTFLVKVSQGASFRLASLLSI